MTITRRQNTKVFNGFNVQSPCIGFYKFNLQSNTKEAIYLKEVTFSMVCKIFHNHMRKKEMTTIARALLNIFTEDEKVVNEKKEPYCIDTKEYIEFFKGEHDIYPNIKSVAKQTSARNIEVAITNIFDDYIPDLEHEDVADELCKLIEEDTSIEEWRKTDVLKDVDIYSQTAKIFLYAIENDNCMDKKPKKKKLVKVKSTLEALREIIKALPKPVAIDIPEELTNSEMTYVSAILETFAEDAGVQVITKGDLLDKRKYSNYKLKFNRYRKDYYAAESIRESLKDTILPEDGDVFEELKSETYDAIIEKVEDTYDTSYSRMTKTLEYVCTISLNSLLAQIPGWVMASQKKGLCHMLVNEEKIRWKT